MRELRELCLSWGIEPTYTGLDGDEHIVSETTLAAFAKIFGLDCVSSSPVQSIDDARHQVDPVRCYMPDFLEDGKVWGLTCFVPALRSGRNLGHGDFRDVAELVQIVAGRGADFLGINPLHALFWADANRCSPFSPSSRSFLNPLYLALEWIEEFDGFQDHEILEAERLRQVKLIEYQACRNLKDRVLRRLFSKFAGGNGEFDAFCADGGEELHAHALFEAISGRMVERGHGAGWTSWPQALRDRHSDVVQRLSVEIRYDLRFHLWSQWQAHRQLERVQASALAAGMRIGLYGDLAVGTAPDGSSTWMDPGTYLPDVKIGAPPDSFSLSGQDWGLAPISPLLLSQEKGRAMAAMMEPVMRPLGALRIDHAMSLARLWLLPPDGRAIDGTYVRYPLCDLMRRVAECSRVTHCIVIGEDLGVVPSGFSKLMQDRNMHSYKVWFFERTPKGVAVTADWPRAALACVGTHDMPTVSGWLSALDINNFEDLSLMPDDMIRSRRNERGWEKSLIANHFSIGSEILETSLALHRDVAESPCRLAAVRIEDALVVSEQVNIPGTFDEYPNWRHRLTVSLEHINQDSNFVEHVRVMAEARPK